MFIFSSSSSSSSTSSVTIFVLLIALCAWIVDAVDYERELKEVKRKTKLILGYNTLFNMMNPTQFNIDAFTQKFILDNPQMSAELEKVEQQFHTPAEQQKARQLWALNLAYHTAKQLNEKFLRVKQEANAAGRTGGSTGEALSKAEARNTELEALILSTSVHAEQLAGAQGPLHDYYGALQRLANAANTVKVD